VIYFASFKYLLEKELKKKRDYDLDYFSFRGEVLCNIISEFGIPMLIVRLIKNTYWVGDWFSHRADLSTSVLRKLSSSCLDLTADIY
jgi:hypothetical protein